MSYRTELGKIQSAIFGKGGYQDVQIGLWLVFRGKGWGVSYGYNGGWTSAPDKYCKWSIEDQNDQYAKLIRDVVKILSDANVNDVTQLVGIPVECTFDFNTLKSFRILTEVL